MSKKPKLIDQMASALETAGIEFERGGWKERQPPDECEWLDIHLYSPKKSIKYTVHLYFENDSKTLTEVSLFKAKRKRGYGRSNPVTKKRVTAKH